MSAALTAFTTTHRVVNWVHDNTTVTGTTAKPTVTTGLTANLEIVFGIRNNTHSGTAGLKNHAHLAAGHLDDSIFVITGHQLSIGTCTANHLGTLAGTQLNVVNQSTERNLSKCEGVTNFRSSTLTRHNGLTHFQPLGSKDITLLTVSIKHKSNARTAVRVILNSLNNCRNTILVSLEVNKTV